MMKLMMKVDKENSNVNFNEEFHKYWSKDDNEKYVSVTTLIESFVTPFDSEFFSKYKALERLLPTDVFKLQKGGLLAKKVISDDFLKSVNITKELLQETTDIILKEWKAKNEEACTRGTAIHAEQENLFYERNFKVLQKEFNITRDYICEKHKYDLLNTEKGVFPEILLDYKDGILRVAGQSDVVIKIGNEIWVWDFKTNAKLDQKSYFNVKTKKYTKMLYPLNDLMDCNMVHYQIQLSTYAWMIQQLNPDFVIKGLKIVHFDHDGKEIHYDLEYIPDAVESMLLYYKRELEHKEFLKKNEKIRFK